MSRGKRKRSSTAPHGDVRTACTPLRKLISEVAARIPEPHHTGAAYYRAWLEAIPNAAAVGDGPEDELSVSWCDGELCACLPELVRYLRGQQKKAGEKIAVECYREFVQT